MSTVLTVDVGLRNLAMCIMKREEDNPLILLWDVYNLLNEDSFTCQELTLKGAVCGKKCGYKHIDKETSLLKYTCKCHFPKSLLPICKGNLHSCLLVKDYSLQDIAKAVIDKVNFIVKSENCILNVDEILIELQPKVNRKMIFVSHIIYGKFVDLFSTANKVPVIKFVRASEKLKCYTGPEIICTLADSYSRRKWLSVEYTKWILKEKCNHAQKWLEFLSGKSTKADMSDTFLMAINALFPETRNRFLKRIGTKTTFKKSGVKKVENSKKTPSKKSKSKKNDDKK